MGTAEALQIGAFLSRSVHIWNGFSSGGKRCSIRCFCQLSDGSHRLIRYLSADKEEARLPQSVYDVASLVRKMSGFLL